MIWGRCEFSKCTTLIIINEWMFHFFSWTALYWINFAVVTLTWSSIINMCQLQLLICKTRVEISLIRGTISFENARSSTISGHWMLLQAQWKYNVNDKYVTQLLFCYYWFSQTLYELMAQAKVIYFQKQKKVAMVICRKGWKIIILMLQ